MRDITAEIKPHVTAIIADANSGEVNKRSIAASRVISLHRMHCSAPQDPGAYGLCCAAFDEWKDETGKPQ